MKEDRHRDPCGLQIGNRLSNGLVCVFEGIVCFAHHTIPMTATIAATMTSQEKADSSLVVSAALTEGRMVFASLGIMVLYHDTMTHLMALMRKPMLRREPLMIPDRRMPPKLAANVRKVNLIAPTGLLERIDHSEP